MIADLNGDGIDDLAAVSGSTVTIVLLNANLTERSRSTISAGTDLGYVVAADFNGDGKPDLAVTNPDSGTVAVLLNNGNGTFRAGAEYGVGKVPQSILAVDFTGDGSWTWWF